MEEEITIARDRDILDTFSYDPQDGETPDQFESQLLNDGPTQFDNWLHGHKEQIGHEEFDRLHALYDRIYRYGKHRNIKKATRVAADIHAAIKTAQRSISNYKRARSTDTHRSAGKLQRVVSGDQDQAMRKFNTYRGGTIPIDDTAPPVLQLKQARLNRDNLYKSIKKLKNYHDSGANDPTKGCMATRAQTGR